MNVFLDRAGKALASYLSKPRRVHAATAPTPADRLLSMLEPGDVLLVEGHSLISSAIKYLTNSTWSHAALYVGEFGRGRLPSTEHLFVEADVNEGVRSVGFSEFEGHATRICRPVGLQASERKTVCDYAMGRIGDRYDLKNVTDLARFLLPNPPVPQRWRRRMIALGSGDPTRAICSTLIAQAFESIRYPILPVRGYRPAVTPECADCSEEIMHIRHHSLYAPRDFDVSPYFQIVKPTIQEGFDHRAVAWADRAADL